jgi:microcystin-dependent protein
MSEAYVGEIRLFAGHFAPDGWFLCDGALLQIDRFEQLYALIGTIYGGDGTSTFALPDFRSRIPVGIGALGGYTYLPGAMGGLEYVSLTQAQMPAHTHPVNASSGAPPNASSAIAVTDTGSATWVPASPAKPRLYASAADLVPMGTQVDAEGGGQSHDNIGPYLALNFIIAHRGNFPSFS